MQKKDEKVILQTTMYNTLKGSAKICVEMTKSMTGYWSSGLS